MSRATVLLAVAVLVLAAACRADEYGAEHSDLPLPPVKDDSVAPLDTSRELPAGAGNKQQEATKTEAPATLPDAAATPPASEESDDVPCAANAHASHVQRLWQWLTYHPLQRPGLCGCCHRCVPYCNAPLYAFFPCSAGGCGAGPCASSIPETVPAVPGHHVGSRVRAYLRRNHAEPETAAPAHPSRPFGFPQHAE
jgi:hypothetical protein